METETENIPRNLGKVKTNLSEMPKPSATFLYITYPLTREPNPTFIRPFHLTKHFTISEPEWRILWRYKKQVLRLLNGEIFGRVACQPPQDAKATSNFTFPVCYLCLWILRGALLHIWSWPFCVLARNKASSKAKTYLSEARYKCSAIVLICVTNTLKKKIQRSFYLYCSLSFVRLVRLVKSYLKIFVETFYSYEKGLR